MKTVLFHQNQLCLRGTTIAVYEYADYNEKILGNKSIIASNPNSSIEALPKFQKRFEHVYLDQLWNYENIIRKHKVDFTYFIKMGSQDGMMINPLVGPSLIHVVFRFNDPHGHRYRFVSDWLAEDQGYNPETHSVPHIVEKLPNSAYDLREKLGISKNKTVFGCYGGSTEFNISSTHSAIKDTVKNRDDIVFLFMNINKFTDPHPNIIHLPGTWVLEEKAAFVRACDAMIHARSGGETFGKAVAEFCIENKPVITYELSGERAHIEILKNRGIYYKGYEDCFDILNNLNKYAVRDDYYKAYDNYAPNIIMDKFNKLFLQ
jgi:hypothetical protein